jgi:hypothetical protein
MKDENNCGLREVKQVLPMGGCLQEEGEHKERGEENEYGGSILHSCIKTEQ